MTKLHMHNEINNKLNKVNTFIQLHSGITKHFLKIHKWFKIKKLIDTLLPEALNFANETVLCL